MTQKKDTRNLDRIMREIFRQGKDARQPLIVPTLVGPSGAGKTAAMSSLADMKGKTFEGTIIFDEIERMTPEQMDKAMQGIFVQLEGQQEKLNRQSPAAAPILHQAVRMQKPFNVKKIGFAPL